MIDYNTGTLTVDQKLNLIEASESYYDYGKADDNSFLDKVLPEDHHHITEMLEALTKGERTDVCFRFIKRDGESSWIGALCERIPTDDSYCIRLVYKDLTMLSANVKTNKIDYGSGLLTKEAITDFVKQKCNNPNNRIDLCILDIDNFKKINDTKGHSFGDKVIREVSDVIIRILGGNGVAGRIGGDEIMFIIENAEDKAKLRSYLKPLRESVEKLYKDANGVPLITVSIGTANFPLYADNYDALFNLADRMLYRAKNRGKNRYVMYNPDIHGAVINGVLNEDIKGITDKEPQDKMRFMMDCMEGLFDRENLPVSEIVMHILASYDIDEGYIFIDDLTKSYFGFRRVEDTALSNQGRMSRIVENSVDVTYVREDELQQMFNQNGVLVIDSPEVQLKMIPAPRKAFEDKAIKHAFFYKMSLEDAEGYLILYNTRNISRKFAQPDITDFTYLGKMLEIALKSR